MINNIKNNTISETDAKQKLNELDEIRKAETKNKRLINGQKVLLSFIDDLVETIFNNNIVTMIVPIIVTIIVTIMKMVMKM